MKKRIFAILMAVMMLVTLIGSAIPAMAAGEITLRLHYHREDGEYEGWEMWFWDNSAITTLEPPYQFEEIDGEMVSTIQINPGTMQIGYIVRYGNWEKKDIDKDQFIDITGVLKGTIDVYVESGVEGQEIVYGEDVETGVVVTQNKYNPENRKGYPEVQIMLSTALDYEATADTFQIIGPDGNVIPLADDLEQNYIVSKQFVYLYLDEQLDLSKSYSIKFEDRLTEVVKPDYFSYEGFESEFTYTGDDLGQTYTKESTTLRVWAPTANAVSVRLYADGDVKAQPMHDEEIPMTADVNGTWVVTLEGDLNGTYYTYNVDFGAKQSEAADPYARTTGVNGNRSMIIDLDSTDPEGWDSDKNPHAGENFTDAVIWELHVRDLSTDSSSGITNVGKYLGVIEKGTKTPGGVSTGLDHMVDLGITHVHLLPVYDYSSVDETTLDEPDAQKFNWGYDPKNYNVPEGAYSTDPYNGEVRVKEFKQMVKGLHDAGISVIMDVVYNHVADANGFCFNKIVPGYFTRPNSNGSGCGNDVASERSMVSKYIVDSVVYWAEEYHIDGFRFDLAGLIDTDTINTLMAEVKKTNPDVVFYGEGWAAGSTTTTKDNVDLTVMANASKVPGFAFFSDTIRNEVKGNTYGGVQPAFISGGNYSASTLFACYQGLPAWCPTPSQQISYISAHDNNTLFDHIQLAAKGSTTEQHIAMNKLGAAFYITAQGIPFMQAGEEFLRSKPMQEGDEPNNDRADGFVHNSYNAVDAVNSLKWSDLEKDEYQATYQYYKGLIAFRKAHPALRLTNAADAKAHVTELTDLGDRVVGYQVTGGVNGEENKAIVSLFNSSTSAKTVTLPAGEWKIYVNGEKAGTEVLGTASGTVEVAALSAMILVDESAVDGGSTQNPGETTAPTTATTDGSTEPGSNNTLLWVILGVVVVGAAAAVVVVLKKKNG